MQNDSNVNMDTGVSNQDNGDAGANNERNVISEVVETRTESGEEFTRELSSTNSYAEEVLRLLEPEVAERFRTYGKQFRQTFGNSTRKYIADVFLPRHPGNSDEALGYLAERVAGRKYGFFGYTTESDHWHIYHDCSYSSRSCRCVFREMLSRSGTFKKNERFIYDCSTISESDWIVILIYYVLGKRGVKGLSYQGVRLELPLDSQLVQNRESIREWAEELREKQAFCTLSDAYQRQHRNKRNIGQVDGTAEGGIHDASANAQEFHGKKSKRISIWDKVQEMVWAILRQYHCAPLQTVCSLATFKKSSVLTNPRNEIYVTKALQMYSDDLNTKSLEDFYNLLKGKKDAIFYKGMDYGELEESKQIIIKLLEHQFQDDPALIKDFLTTLVLILDRQIPKCNCIVIHSPPSGGKNFFLDMICAIMVNYGQLGIANKTNQFAFMQAYNKRLLIWNEPNYEPCMTDLLKMMMAGDPYNVRFKSKDDVPVSRTPVIVMTNNPVGFMSDPAFKDRLRIYRWTTAPFLKDCQFKPHPMSFFEILFHYNIVNYNKD